MPLRRQVTVDAYRQQCKQAKNLFVDKEFPADNSILPIQHQNDRDIKWLRPSEISKKPVLVSDGMSRNDVCQGEIGNCYFLASLAALTTKPVEITKILNLKENPNDLKSSNKDYVGLLCFSFWRFSRWREVIIDDMLPTRNGRLCFASSADKDEFWPALVEKAYAKFYNCSYQNIVSGSAENALTDLAGGIAERLNFQEELNTPDELWNTITESIEQGALISCAINGGNDKGKDLGLISGHAYTLVTIATINSFEKPVNLIRIRNPWGSDVEWSGDWGDNSDTWKSVSDEDHKLNDSVAADGEFWMSTEDVFNYFNSISVSHDVYTINKHNMLYLTFDGKWIKGFSAGGPPSSWEKFATNQQYIVEISDSQGDDKKGTLIVSLMRKSFTSSRGSQSNTGISFFIYHLSKKWENASNLPVEFFKYNRSVEAGKYVLSASREYVRRFNLDPGKYCIVPFMNVADVEESFHIRILAECDVSENKMLRSIQEEDPLKDKGYSGSNDDEFQAELEVRVRFEKLAGVDGVIDSEELSNLINSWHGKSEKPINSDQCWTLIQLVDDSNNGKLEYGEFSALWALIVKLKSIFMKFAEGDNLQQNKIQANKVIHFFKELDYNLNNTEMMILINRFSASSRGFSFADLLLTFAKLQMVEKILEGDKPAFWFQIALSL